MPRFVQRLPSLLAGRLLHKLAALILAAAGLSQGISQVLAGNLGDQPRRPNIVFILADDKYDRTIDVGVFSRTIARFIGAYAIIPNCDGLRAIECDSVELTTLCYSLGAHRICVGSKISGQSIDIAPPADPSRNANWKSNGELRG